MTQGATYSSTLLRDGRGLVAWQRYTRFRRAAEVLRAHFELRPIETLVDIGAADGIGLPFWQRIAGHVISVNHSLGYCAGFREAWPDKTLMLCSAQYMPFRTKSVSAVVCLETLHFLPGAAARVQALKEIHRVLRPDGVFVCSVAIEVGLPALVKYAGRRAAGITLHGMSLMLMLRHLFHLFVNVAQYDCGQQLGFDAYQFGRDFGKNFEEVRRIRIPLPYPLCTTLLLAGRPRAGQ